MTDEEAWRYYMGRPAPASPPAKPGCLWRIANGAIWIGAIAVMLVALAMGVPRLLELYGLVELVPVGGGAQTTGSKAQPTAPSYQPRPQVGGGGGASTTFTGSAPLPPCEGVTDTKTACQWQTQPTEAPVATPEPAYMATCVTPPGERPCWLPEGEPWSPPESVPETPVVYVPEATAVPLVFVDAACANWKPPQVYPEGCP